MMSDRSVIDYVARDEVNRKLVLIIQEDRPWKDTRTMHVQLKAKIDTYYGYIMDSAFSQEYPGTAPSDVVITLFCKEQPGPGSLQFFHYVRQVLAEDKIGFSFIVHNPQVAGPFKGPGLVH